MRWLANYIQKMFCSHWYRFERNIYGDEINACGGKRSLYRCCRCGKGMLEDTLYRNDWDYKVRQDTNLYRKENDGS